MSKPPREVLGSIDWPSAAHHEAGHALASVLLGFSLGYALIRFKPYRGGGWSVDGYTHVNDKPGDDPNLLAVVALAGPMAEALWMNRTLGTRMGAARREAQRENPRDVEALRSYLSKGTARERDIADQAETLVSRNWRAVGRIAAELLQRQELSGRRIQQLV